MAPTYPARSPAVNGGRLRRGSVARGPAPRGPGVASPGEVEPLKTANAHRPRVGRGSSPMRRRADLRLESEDRVVVVVVDDRGRTLLDRRHRLAGLMPVGYCFAL